MTSENAPEVTKDLVGTIRREAYAATDHAPAGYTIWVLVQDCATKEVDGVTVYDGEYVYWLALHSTDVGNLGGTLSVEELVLDTAPIVGVVPGTPAEQEELTSLDKVIQGNYPETTLGTRSDGSPWVIWADFGSGVAINSTGDLWDNKRVITVEQATRKATALKDAAEWVKNNLGQAVEDYHVHLRGRGLEVVPKQKPKKTRIAVDKVGYLYHHEPRQAGDKLPWIRVTKAQGQTEIRSAGDVRSGLIELTDADMITVTATNTSAVAAFMGGTLEPARKCDDLCDVVVPGDGRVGLRLLMRIWRTEDVFCVAPKDSSLVIPVRRGA